MTSKTAPRIAFQGALGAYSHEACLQARPDMIPVPCMTFEGVIRAVREGRADLDQDTLSTLRERNQVSLQFVDNYGERATRYPFNPNGSTEGVTGLCAANGRVTIMMPHPERNFRTVTNSWHPEDWGEHGPWLRIFQNARAFVN